MKRGRLLSELTGAYAFQTNGKHWLSGTDHFFTQTVVRLFTRVQPPPSRKTRRMYAVTADFKNEELLADASETLASTRTIAHDFAHLIPASQRRTLLGIAQLIMLGELAVNRVMDNLELPQ